MQYYILNEFSRRDQQKKVAKIKDLLKRRMFEHWDSSRKTGVSRYKRESDKEPSLELVFHYDQKRGCELTKFEKDMKELAVR